MTALNLRPAARDGQIPIRMKTALTAFLLLAAWAGPAGAGINGLERIAVSGADYVRLGDWADKDELTLVWRSKDDPIW